MKSHLFLTLGLSAIAAFGQTKVASIPLGPQPGMSLPSNMIINPATHKLYILGFDVAVVDLNTNRLLTTVALPNFTTPDVGGQLFVNPNTNRIYVFKGTQFDVIDGATDTHIQSFNLPAMVDYAYKPIVFNPNTNKFYVGAENPVGNPLHPGEVRVLDGTTFAQLSAISGRIVNDTTDLPNTPKQILVNPANNRVYIVYELSGDWLQIIDGTDDSVVSEATCTTTSCSLIFGPGLGEGTINPIDNSVWFAISFQAPGAPGGEDGAGGIPGPPQTVFYRLDPVTNQLTTQFFFYGRETAMLSIDPNTGFIYMMAQELPTVLNPTWQSPIYGTSPMLVVLDPNHVTPTATEPSPMKPIVPDGSLPHSPCTISKPLSTDFTLGNIYWQCAGPASSVVITKTNYTNVSGFMHSPMAAQVPTTAIGSLDAQLMPLFISGGYYLISNIAPTHVSTFLSIVDDAVVAVDPISATATTITLGAQPTGIAVNPATKRAYVTDLTSQVLSVIDTSSNAVIATPLVGGPLIAANPLTSQYVVAGPANDTTVPNGVNHTVLFDGASGSVARQLQAAATSGVALNPATNVAYFADGSQWYAVDLATGNQLFTVSDLTPAGADTCQMTGISVNKATNHVFVAGTCAAGGRTLAAFDGATKNLLASVNVNSVMTNIGRLIVNPNTNNVYVEATILTGASLTIQTPSVEVFDGASLGHINSVLYAAGPFAVNTVTNLVYGGGSGVHVVDGLLPGQTGVFGTAVPTGLAVDESANLIYVTINRDPGNLVSGGAPARLDVYHQDPPVFPVFGYVFNGAVAQGGISATITGPATNITTVSGPNGLIYAILPAGTYTVTASSASFALSPSTQIVTVSNAQVQYANIAATPIFHIAGTVLTLAGAPVAGVTISAQGAGGSAAAVTDANGLYSLAGLPAGSYAVAPVSPANFYSPTSQSVSLSKADVSGVSFTVDPAMAITAFTVNPSLIGAGVQATGTVTINQVAPKGGVSITVASSDTKTVKPPASFNIPAGSSTGTFTFQGSGVSAATAVTLTATYTGSLALQPSFATAQVTVAPTDSVHITSATWSTSTQQLQVTATSTNSQATLTAFLAANGQSLGTLTRQSNGSFTVQVAVASKPASITVKSNLGGSSGQGITVVP